MTHILVIEDDATTALQLAGELEAQGHQITTATDGLEGLDLAGTGRFDAITLDRMLPGLDGLTVVARLRANRIDTPVLMISALSDIDERVAGLRAGGDDYLVKPFAPAEMIARVEVLLRRAAPIETMLQVGAIRIDLIRHDVSIDGVVVRLLPMEYKLLEFLARHAGQTIGRQLIFEQVWGYYFDPGANVINVHIARLRRKLDRQGLPSPIATVKGEGYRLDAV
ncbi:response regulator transcription factor [Sphingomonas nostoxanthinifaciens]|uniref:response regulator transcription factor n=1 Tax=Sphingomonas nostoxanthinifaciens TaxID=2872652 RepID=UPI001CC1D1F6|nr:response regulator transcription factor [Sphingomonas nostoxanthinifaciens]UAK25952.1 response regulator transcription factor [Sphingomonas nostoxanthinifaciens]